MTAQTILPRTLPMLMGGIGLACCTLALYSMRSQAADQNLQSSPDMLAGRPAPHHMRGWQHHGTNASGATQRVEWITHGTG